MKPITLHQFPTISKFAKDAHSWVFYPGVYKYFSGAGEVSDKLYISGAGEIFKYTSPAPEKPGKYLKTPFRRRRSIYTHFSGIGEVLIEGRSGTLDPFFKLSSFSENMLPQVKVSFYKELCNLSFKILHYSNKHQFTKILKI